MKKLLTFCLCTIMAISLFGCTSTPSNSSTPSSAATTTASSTTAKKNTYGKGDTATIDKVKVTLVNVTENQGSEYLKPDTGNVFLVYEFTIENGTDKDVAISSMMSFEAYVDDTTTTINISAMTSVSGKSQLDGTIAAGKKMNGIIGYEVPSTWKKTEVYFKPNVLKSDKVVFTYNK